MSPSPDTRELEPPPVRDPAERWSPDRIGEIVSSYRRERKMKVSELARRVGVTPSLISQIEHGNSRPSVPTLFALAEALDLSVDVLAGRPAADATSPPARVETPAPRPTPSVPAVEESPINATEPRYVVRRDSRRTIEIQGGVQWEMLTPSTPREAEFVELVYAPHAESNPTQYRHPGTEMVLVLEGRFDIHIGFDVYELTEGDSIHFPSSIPHRYVNPTDDTARAVTVILREHDLDTLP
jgi:transcriptional regulator with XRE-family HTH domain